MLCSLNTLEHFTVCRVSSLFMRAPLSVRRLEWCVLVARLWYEAHLKLQHSLCSEELRTKFRLQVFYVRYFQKGIFFLSKRCRKIKYLLFWPSVIQYEFKRRKPDWREIEGKPLAE